MKKLYLAVTPDRFELPIAVTDTGIQMARLFGISSVSLRTAIFRNLSGTQRGVRFLKILIDEGEE